ncbi:M56 family metallopeptidase [Dyadobacter sp. CY261]|uniref:M56 family metallopeptidase n=1 Tax=Dyadobacter sp. CY261 TaxID=2907203 RepID=UPI001F3C46CC|nr:M56 family metallopeptidase [Dyadobacter sp. CY261]MCF0073261.1 M56 family metallopeptidase [Dyadobacter sp. CY261]
MLIPYLMKVSLVLAVLTLAYRWLIQFETFSKLNRVLLWLNVVVSWTLPLVSLPDWGPVEVQSGFHHSLPKVVGKIPILAEPLAVMQSETFKAPASVTHSSMSITDWLLIIYLTGVVVLAVYFIFQIGRLFLLVAKGRREHWDHEITVVCVRGSTPYSFFKWIILDPEKHSGSERDNILAHEAEHARQCHSADLLVAEMQRICLWFNPFSWIHQKLVQENLEYLADRAVLDNGFEKKQYQYNLLNTALRTRELPLTNSFAQSLLKKRIKMMNRKPSHYLVWGKYVVVLALIYISSAFVAPYREQIVELAPAEIKPLVQPLIGEVIVTTPTTKYSTEDQLEMKAKPDKKQIVAPADTIQETPESQPKVKGVLIVNQTLYWAITPLTTWEEINEIKAAIQKFGQDFQINKIQFDPLQQYITSISVRINTKNGSGSGEEHGSNEFEPMKGYSGYVAKQGHGMGALPPDALSKEMEQDYQKALAIAKENEVAYFEYKLARGFGPHSSTTFPRKLLEGPSAEQFFSKNGIGKSSGSTLRISEYHKNATLYLNTNTATFSELNEVPFSKVEKVSLLEDNARRKYIIVYAR